MQKTIKLYETPDMKVFEMHAEGVMCDSYGEVGRAGANGEFHNLLEDEDEEDY